MAYKAVIFDLDGTLVNSLADLADSVNEVLAEYGYPVHRTEEYKRMVGNGARMLIKRAFPDGSEESVVDEALAKYKAIYARRFLIKTKPYKGILPLLQKLHDEKISLAVCTNKHHEAASVIVEALFPDKIFQYICGEQPGKPRKPMPDSVLSLAKKMHVLPEETVYVGDSEVDMQTGVNANMLPVGVLWGFRERHELEENGARVILTEPLELLTKVNFSA